MFGFSPAIPSRRDFEWCPFLRKLGRSGEAVERVLHDIGVMDHSGWADWAPSTLTATGAPTEVVFTADSPGLCITTEVDDPARPPQDRLDKACRIMADLGGTPPGPALRDVLAAAQSAGRMSFGALLQIAQDGNARQTRLLVELPAAADDLGLLMIPEVTRALKGIGPSAVRLAMVTYDGQTGALTMHGTIRGAHRGHLPLLADIAQVSPDNLAQAIDGLAAAAPCGGLPVRNLCFGMTAGVKGQPPTLTLSMMARELLGDCDATITERINACGGARLRGYATLLDHLAPGAVPGVTIHGRIGLTARQNAMPVLSVNVAAPWSDPA